MHDTGRSARSLIDMLLEFALNYVELETTTIKRVKIVSPDNGGEHNG